MRSTSGIYFTFVNCFQVQHFGFSQVLPLSSFLLFIHRCVPAGLTTSRIVYFVCWRPVSFPFQVRTNSVCRAERGLGVFHPQLPFCLLSAAWNEGPLPDGPLRDTLDLEITSKGLWPVLPWPWKFPSKDWHPGRCQRKDTQHSQRLWSISPAYLSRIHFSAAPFPFACLYTKTHAISVVCAVTLRQPLASRPVLSQYVTFCLFCVIHVFA